MPDGHVIEFDRVTKRFGDVAAVTEFSGRVEPGVVTGFLGPNGAGKTTTLRILLGQVAPTSGTATIGGALYDDLKHPARVLAAMPENPVFRPRRTVERHLVVAAKSHGIPLSRVDEVIRFVGLGSEADARIGTLSLGMRQRLSAATALLGDPTALVLDEPANGLDPEGIRWMRMLIRGLADEGRTVLVSSHVLSEVEQMADDILIIARGRRKFAGSLATLADPTAGPVVVDADDRDALEAALTDAGYEFEILRSGLTVRGSDAARIGKIAAAAGVALTTLQQRGPTLEDVFVDLVNDRPVQFRKPEEETGDAEAADGGGSAPTEETEAGESLSAEQEPGADAAGRADAADQAGAAVETDTDEADAPQTGAVVRDAAQAGADEADAADETDAGDETASAAPGPALPGVSGLAAAAAGVLTPRPELADKPEADKPEAEMPGAAEDAASVDEPTVAGGSEAYEGPAAASASVPSVDAPASETSESDASEPDASERDDAVPPTWEPRSARDALAADAEPGDDARP